MYLDVSRWENLQSDWPCSANRLADLEDLDAKVEIIIAWKTIRNNIKISAKESLGYFELKKHKPRFDEGCTELLDQRKQAKLQ
jgi:hypothetical protein